MGYALFLCAQMAVVPVGDVAWLCYALALQACGNVQPPCGVRLGGKVKGGYVIRAGLGAGVKRWQDREACAWVD